MVYQAVTDGENGVGLQGLAQRNSQLEDADQKPGDDVDSGDQYRSQGVPLVEPGRTIHGAIELRFMSNLLAPGPRLGLINDSGIQVGINCHLLAGQRIEREARRNFCGPDRTMADHQILNSNQRREQHQPDHVVSADNKLAERLNDVPGRGRAFVSMQKNSAAGGEIQRQPEQREQ
jgi:hypothetical protein